MLPEFFTTRYLFLHRLWRREQVFRLLGKTDAIFEDEWSFYSRPPRPEELYDHKALDRLTERRRIHRRAYLRSRVEAVEQSGVFEPNIDLDIRRRACWVSLQVELSRLVDRAAGLEEPKPLSKPIYRLDTSDHFHPPWCSQRRLRKLRVEQTQAGFTVVDAYGLLIAHFRHAEWALPLAMAIAGKRLVSFDGAAGGKTHEMEDSPTG